MKMVILFFVLAFAGFVAEGQPAAEIISTRIAQKMGDSLHLSQVEKDSIYSMSIRIHNEKVNVLNTYKGTPQFRQQLEAVENKRDSLYQTVLPELTYIHYRERKRYFVVNN